MPVLTITRPRAVWAHFTRRCGRHMPFKRTLRARQRRASRSFTRGWRTS